MKITETCGCGASFSADHPASPSVLQAAANDWRENHKHTESVGICGDRPPPLRIGDSEIARPHCELRAGHDGMHG